jgi:predicted DNA-binding protein (MmcQ/YjbR family)
VKLEAYNAFCAGLGQTHCVIQWGGAHVWKVGGDAPSGAGGKVFAIATAGDGGTLHVTFKCSEMSFAMLRGEPGCRPAPYLASRGMLWIQRTGAQTLDDDALCAYLRESRRLAAMNLPRRRQIGLD